MAQDQTLNTLRRRLEKWELQHLRALAAELAARLERAEEELRRANDETGRAWESAEFWQRNATDMQLELMEADYTVGLTQDGQIVAIKPEAPAAIDKDTAIAMGMKVREPYTGTFPEKKHVPRESIFIGTTNEAEMLGHPPISSGFPKKVSS